MLFIRAVLYPGKRIPCGRGCRCDDSERKPGAFPGTDGISRRFVHPFWVGKSLLRPDDIHTAGWKVDRWNAPRVYGSACLLRWSLPRCGAVDCHARRLCPSSPDDPRRTRRVPDGLFLLQRFYSVLAHPNSTANGNTYTYSVALAIEKDVRIRTSFSIYLLGFWNEP